MDPYSVLKENKKIRNKYLGDDMGLTFPNNAEIGVYRNYLEM